MKVFIRLFLALSAIALTLFVYYLYSLSFDQLKNIVTPDKIYKTIFGEELEGTRYNKDRYEDLRVVGLWIYTILLITFIFLFKKVTLVIEKGKMLYSLYQGKLNNFYKLLIGLSTTNKIILIVFFIVIFVFKAILLFVIEADNDELRSYEYFVDQGFWITITYYPDTNNHIFYNIICLVFNFFLKDGLWVMRIPAIIANLLLLLLLWMYTFKKFGFATSVLILSLSAFIYEAAFFGVIGRGHLWMCLFAFLSLFAFLDFLKEPRWEYLFCVILFSVLGLYTVPTYVFFLGSLYLYGCVFILTKKKFFLIPSLVFSCITIIAGTLFCYLPVILINGWDVLLGHRWVQPLSFTHFLSLLPVYLKELPEYVMGIHGHIAYGYAFVALLVICFWISFFKMEEGEKRWFILLLVFFVVPILLICFLRFFPPYRVFTYYIFMLYIGIGIFMNYLIRSLKISGKNQMVFAVIFFLIFLGIGVKSFLI